MAMLEKFILKGFDESLLSFKKQFKMPFEIVREDRNAEIGDFFEKLASTNDNQLEHFAYRLTIREVETAILSAPICTDSRIVKVIELRLTPRLLLITWLMYQQSFNKENPVINKVKDACIRYIRENDINTEVAEVLKALDGEDVVKRLNDFIKEKSDSINGLAKRYQIMTDSPLAFETATLHFQTCEKVSYVVNGGWLVRVIEQNQISVVAKIIKPYITKLTEREFITAVNEAIIVKMGYPLTSMYWDDIPENLKFKFAHWCFLRELREYFATNRIKLQVYENYIRYFKEVKFLSDYKLFVMDFGDFVILDDGEDTAFSFLSTKSNYEMNIIKSQEGIDSLQNKLFEAKDFIIEEISKDLLRLNFYDVGRLYVRELLDIILSIIPDTRKSKTLVVEKFRRKKNSSS